MPLQTEPLAPLRGEMSPQRLFNLFFFFYGWNVNLTIMTLNLKLETKTSIHSRSLSHNSYFLSSANGFVLYQFKQSTVYNMKVKNLITEQHCHTESTVILESLQHHKETKC